MENEVQHQVYVYKAEANVVGCLYNFPRNDLRGS